MSHLRQKIAHTHQDILNKQLKPTKVSSINLSNSNIIDPHVCLLLSSDYDHKSITLTLPAFKMSMKQGNSFAHVVGCSMEIYKAVVWAKAISLVRDQLNVAPLCFNLILHDSGCSMVMKLED